MIRITERDGGIILSVRVMPRASRDAIEGEYQGALKVRLTAPPVDDRANDALIRLLAERLNVPRSAVRIVAGEKSRTKRVEIAGARREQITAFEIVNSGHAGHKSDSGGVARQQNRRLALLRPSPPRPDRRRASSASGETGWRRAAGSISSPRAASRGSWCTGSRQGALDSLAGRKIVYSGWEELHGALRKLLSGSRKIAMQYSPENNIPYIGLVDAGTVELVRKLKKRVVTSADLVQKFEAAWTAEQLESHLEAGKIIDRVHEHAFDTRGGMRARRRSAHGIRAAAVDSRPVSRERTDHRRAAHRGGAAE